MNKHAFCTIITIDYLHYALSLNESLLRYQEDITLYLFITDDLSKIDDLKIEQSNIHLLDTKDLCKTGIGRELYSKYFRTHKDEFRWSMKGILMNYLLQEKNYDKTIYVDCDIYFFNNYNFLWEALNHNNILLTPHWRCAIEPTKHPIAFKKIFTQGLFNAGFIGANKKGIPALLQLAKWNLYQCEKESLNAIYDDQTYLNLLPIHFDKVKILKHRGCNVASWNLEECQRVKIGNQVLINGQYPIIFIHFVKDGIHKILERKDALLKPHLDQFYTSLKRFHSNYNIVAHYDLIKFENKEKKIATYIESIKKVEVMEKRWRIKFPKVVKIGLEFIVRKRLRSYYRNHPNKLGIKIDRPTLLKE